MRDEIALDQAINYYDGVVRSDINRADGVQKNTERVKRLMRSYARNQGAQVPNTVIAADITANDSAINEETVSSYINALKMIFVIPKQRFAALTIGILLIHPSQRQH